jgi:hypothetical protein
MKKILIISLIFFYSNLIAGEFKTFVLKDNNYIETKINVEVKSINNICKFLGYNSEEFYTYSNYKNKNSKIVTIILKSFSNKIICVLTDDIVNSLSQSEVDEYMQSFDIKKDLSTYSIEKDLQDAIEKKSLKLEFLSDIFNVKNIDKNGSFIAPSIGYELFFENGILVDYKSSDGLNKWSREWKTSRTSVYDSFYKEAKYYLKDDENAIINEINEQADAFSKIPYGNLNEYIEFHKTKFGNINYKMLLVAHYNEKINIDEFKKINFSRYELINEFTAENGYKNTTYKVNKTLYTFDENGNLNNSYTSK